MNFILGVFRTATVALYIFLKIQKHIGSLKKIRNSVLFWELTIGSIQKLLGVSLSHFENSAKNSWPRFWALDVSSPLLQNSWGLPIMLQRSSRTTAGQQFLLMKDRCFICNKSHFNFQQYVHTIISPVFFLPTQYHITGHA